MKRHVTLLSALAVLILGLVPSRAGIITNIPITRVIALTGSLAFGKIMEGLTSQRTLTIVNAGTTTLTVSGIAYPANFSGNWAGQIPIGTSTNITVTFAPTAVTAYGGDLTVYSDATNGTPTHAVSGTGTVSNTCIVALSGTLSFGDVPLGQTALRTLTIANTGNSTMTVSNITCPGGYSGTWSGALPPGDSTKVPVYFTPAATTIYGGSLTVNANSTSGTKTRALSGTGITPAPSLAIQPNGTNYVITWPTNTTDFVLEYSTNFPPVWATNAKAPALVNGRYTVTNTPSGGLKFYRLKN